MGVNDTDIEFSLPRGFRLETVAAEPNIRQPVYLTFDERGRIWVVQYLQYPFPEGLQVVDHDQYWRVQYDHFPPPAPPHHVKGADRITILEDTNGDGTFDKLKDFVTGLNIVSAALPGGGGVWVLNPPYLLFYPDRDRDDVPDGDPEVHLEGFGLEDPHSVASSLLWGPDGWLYGCAGSTTTATIKRPGLDRDGLHFSGQSIWRYHPEKRLFELFAEGGYNNFGIAMDSKGRMFTGTNGGLIGVHYVQGGYYRKNWGKHGPLTNPYAFGYLTAMEDHSSRAKLSQAMIVYEGPQLPPRYLGTLITARVLQRRLDVCELRPRGSSYSAHEREVVLASPDLNFRPVDLKLGPDGAIYIADWFDSNVTWNVSADADLTDRATGRVYRLSYSGSRPAGLFDLAKASSGELVDHLASENPWYRRMSQRLLRERADASLIPRLTRILNHNQGQLALEALWAIHACGGFSMEFAARQLSHPDPFVRLWTIRLLGDERRASSSLAEGLLQLAERESHPQVRSQLAASAKRLGAEEALPIVAALLHHEEDLLDPHIPMLLWWVIEDKIRSDREAVLSWVKEAVLGNTPLFNQVILPRLGRRFTTDRIAADLLTSIRLLEMARSEEQIEALADGMDKGLRGNRLDRVPPTVLQKVQSLAANRKENGVLLSLAIRLGSHQSVPAALAVIRDPAASQESRIRLVETLFERQEAEAEAVCLQLFRAGKSEPVRSAALEALQHFQSPGIARTLLELLPGMHPPIRLKSLGILASRVAWSRLLLESVDRGRIRPSEIPREVLVKIAGLGDEELEKSVRDRWGRVRHSPEERIAEMLAVKSMLNRGEASPGRGKAVFDDLCSTCHILHDEGQSVGPELTGSDRDDRQALMEAIIDPSASVLPDFIAFAFTIKRDGESAGRQVVTGFVVEGDDKSMTIVDSSGNRLRVAQNTVLSKEAVEDSIMPEGLLHNLEEQQVRDLFAYLQSKAPVGVRITVPWGE